MVTVLKKVVPGTVQQFKTSADTTMKLLSKDTPVKTIAKALPVHSPTPLALKKVLPSVKSLPAIASKVKAVQVPAKKAPPANLKMKPVEKKTGSVADRIRELIVSRKHTDDEIRAIILKECKKEITTISGFRNQLNNGEAEKFGYEISDSPFTRLVRDDKNRLVEAPERTRSAPVPKVSKQKTEAQISKEDAEEVAATKAYQKEQKEKKVLKAKNSASAKSTSPKKVGKK